MKKLLAIFACAAVLMLAQACGKEKKEDSKEYKDSVVVAQNAAKADSTARAERKAQIKKDREEYAERMRLATEERAKAALTYKDAKGKLVYNKAEVSPSYGASAEDLDNYINENINYPTTAQNDQIEGTVFVDFVVGADGKVRDAEVVEATNDAVKQSLSEEAIRVVSSMPPWTPGTQAGKPVDVRVSLPITFQLEM